ncbi:MAG: hypothetical protein BWY88_00928 [Synergistetes bacterium ADurb.Bin520]|nr:MAG: hypothetical protein BWY88_00928 [Synergistetes bacterium ADurb.Bin520]
MSSKRASLWRASFASAASSMFPRTAWTWLRASLTHWMVIRLLSYIVFRSSSAAVSRVYPTHEARAVRAQSSAVRERRRRRMVMFLKRAIMSDHS